MRSNTNNNLKLQISENNVPQFTEVPPAVACCQKLFTNKKNFSKINKVSFIIVYNPLNRTVIYIQGQGTFMIIKHSNQLDMSSVKCHVFLRDVNF